ncbi:MAG: FlgO family outer membrane protein, partial [Paraglaciecola sp.]
PQVSDLAPSQHNINHYIKNLTNQLMSNLKKVNTNTPVAVVSFVMLDSDYNQSSLLGNQISESLIHEIHTHGIPVIDFKTTGYVRVTEKGDFAFSKDYEDFDSKLPADFVVGGTLLKHKDGYLINARIVDFISKSVMATAQNFIPNEIADSLLVNSYKPKVEPEMPRQTPKGNKVSLTSN